MALGKVAFIFKVVFMFKGKRSNERYFIDEFGRLWKGLSVDVEEMSVCFIFAGLAPSGASLWVLQNKSGSEKLTNYEHEEITLDQLERVLQMYQAAE